MVARLIDCGVDIFDVVVFLPVVLVIDLSIFMYNDEVLGSDR